MQNKKARFITALVMGSAMAAAPLASIAPTVTAFAASAAPVAGVSGEQGDVAAAQKVTVSGLKAGSTVKLYQIVDGYYKDGKLVKYVLMDPENGKIAAIGKDDKGQTAGTNDIITEDEIATIANNIQGGAFTADKGTDMTVGTTADGNGLVSATADVEPGLYMVLATDLDGVTVYNPAVVAVNITDINNNTESAGSVDMTKFFTTDAGNVYMKSSTSSVDKKITGSNKAAVEAEGDTAGEKTPVNNYGDTVAEGDTVHFKIDSMTIPSFSADYANPQYIITDTIDDSFDTYSNLFVKVGGKEVKASDTTYKVTANGKAFKIEFTADYLRSLRGTDNDARAVEVTYDSKLANATVNFAENHNRATIQYSNSPTDEASHETVNKDTYVYTFGIDASIDSENADAKTTYEFNKVTGKHASFDGEKSNAPLAGATFTLYSNEACTTIAKTVNQPDGTAVSDADGHISFTGLDEGTYYLKETVAPAGYTLSDQTYKFVIASTLGSDGIMTGYTVTTYYKDATHSTWTDAGTASYTSTPTKTDDGSVTNVIDRTDNAIAIVDTKLQNLPSTGGHGTAMAAIAAVILASGAVVLVRQGKKMENR